MKNAIALCLPLVMFLRTPSSQDIVPKAETIAEMEVSYYNAKLELLDDDESHLNVKVPSDMFAKVLNLFRGATKITLNNMDNELVEVGSVLFKDRASRYYHRFCVFKRFDKSASQFFSLDGKTYSIRADKDIEQVMLQIIYQIKR